MSYFDMNRLFVNDSIVDKEYASDVIVSMYNYVSTDLSEDDEIHKLVDGGTRTELLKKEGSSLAFILGMLTAAVNKKEEQGESFIQWKRRNKIDSVL